MYPLADGSGHVRSATTDRFKGWYEGELCVTTYFACADLRTVDLSLFEVFAMHILVEQVTKHKCKFHLHYFTARFLCILSGLFLEIHWERWNTPYNVLRRQFLLHYLISVISSLLSCDYFIWSVINNDITLSFNVVYKSHNHILSLWIWWISCQFELRRQWESYVVSLLAIASFIWRMYELLQVNFSSCISKVKTI
jgi:hypothetical protein